MKIKYLVAASTLALIASSGAQAADIINTHMEPAAVTVPVFNWQGFYAGGEIGGSWARGKVRAWSALDERSERWSTKPDGFVGGLYAGYNLDAGNNIVLGVDADFIWADANGDDTNVHGVDSVRVRLKQKWAGSARLRVGYAADRWLPYLAGGVAYGRINASSYSYDAAGARIGEKSENKTRTGWTLGTGVDYALTDNVLLRLEYRYTDLGKKTYDIIDAGRARISYRANDFRVGVAYKF